MRCDGGAACGCLPFALIHRDLKEARDALLVLAPVQREFPKEFDVGSDPFGGS